MPNPDYDLHEAVMNLLISPEDIFALVGNEVDNTRRIYGIELPPVQSQSMPAKAIVVKQNGQGGQGRGGFARFQKTLIDIEHYGETPYEAEKVRMAVHRFLKDFRRQMSKGFLIHSFDSVTGPTPLRNPQTEWPYVLETWRCLASET